MDRWTEDLEAEIRALDEGRAFADRSFLRKVAVTGADAAAWLHDLVTAGIEGLEPGEARRSLLLTPTGRVRADFHVVREAGGFLLLQDPSQPRGVGHLLAPYVLSSDVALEDRTDALALFSIPGGALDLQGTSRPSILGGGTDLVVEAGRHEEAAALLAGRGFVAAGDDAVELRRIRHGIPRFPVDFGEDSLPAEAGLESAIDFTKGCFLGQESVAKVRNLGHPPRVVLTLRAARRVVPGEPVVTEGHVVGAVTSAAETADGVALLAAVRWEARSGPLGTAAGEPLLPA